MTDTVVLASAVASIVKSTYQQHGATTPVVGPKVDRPDEKVKPVSGADGASLAGEFKLPHEREAVKEKRELDIKALPLDEPMAQKISHAIDKMVYGEQVVSSTVREENTPVKGYEPISETGKIVDIEG